MKLINLEKIPESVTYYGEISHFGEFDIEELSKCDIDIGYYWYAIAPYEGSGQLLFHTSKGWNLHDCGHCSCFGPIDRINCAVGFDLEELYNNCSEGLKEEVEILFEAARKE